MGMLHVYCGDGKGKTTAAIGLAVRAAGAGMRVCFAQLMKGGETSELAALGLIKNIEIRRCDKDYGFFKNMLENDKREITACHNGLLKFAFSGEFELVVLDEFCSAYKFGLMDKPLAEQLIFNGKEFAEIVITGRDPAKKFTDAADYVSEIACVKHPFERGIAARRGIEF